MSDAEFQRIERMLASLSELSGSYDVELTPQGTSAGGESNAAKLGYLAGQGRDFLTPTREMEATVVAKLEGTVQALLDEDLPVMPHAVDEIGNGVVEHVRGRFERTGPRGPSDVNMPALSQRWAAHKQHANIGIYTGDLARGVSRADVRTRKR